MADSTLSQPKLIDEPSWLESPMFWLSVAVIVVVALGAFSGYFYRINQLNQSSAAAQESYSSAKTPEEKLTVAKANGKLPASPVWLLELGNTFATQKNYASATEAFSLVRQFHPDSPLVPAALLGQAEIEIANDHADRGVELLHQIIGLKGKNAYQPLARLVLARWQVSQKKPADARRTLEDLQTQFPNSAFTGEATEMLAALPR